MSEAEKDKINYIATQNDELRQMVEQHSIILIKHQERLDKLIGSLPLILIVLGGERISDLELDEVGRLARQKGISLAETVNELRKKGTLPPVMKKFDEALRTIKEMLTE